MNKAKFVVSMALGVVGVFVALYPLRPSIPKKSELEVANGVLLSSEFRSKVGSRFQLEGINRNFVYQSHGRLCGNVQDWLLAEIGEPISVRYVPNQTKNWSGELHSLQVYEISDQTNSICSYEQISAMIENDFEAVSLLGYLMSFSDFPLHLKPYLPTTLRVHPTQRLGKSYAVTSKQKHKRKKERKSLESSGRIRRQLTRQSVNEF